MSLPLLPRARCLRLLRERGPDLGPKQLKEIYAHIIAAGLHRQASAIARLIECYSALPIPEGTVYARLIYEHRNNSDEHLWNTMIRSSGPRTAILVYAQGKRRGDVRPDRSTFISVLGACARSMSLSVGKQIHGQALKSGFSSEVVVQTTGIHFYASCRDLTSARQMFDEMPVKTIVTWNAIINGYSSQGGVSSKDHTRESWRLFKEMLRAADARPTSTTMISLLSGCSRLGDLACGLCIHGFIERTLVSEDDVFIGTGLVDMYWKCGSLSSALQVFEKMRARNVLTWTAAIAGLAAHGNGREAIELLKKMENAEIKPNAVTFTCLLWGCCHAGLVEEGIQLFNSMRKVFGIEPRIQHYGCLADLLGRAGLLEEAHKFIVDMPLQPDVLMWRTLLAACNFHGDPELGEKIGKQLLEMEEKGSASGLPEISPVDSQDYVALSNIYALNRRWEDVESLRETMKALKVGNKPGCSSVHCGLSFPAANPKRCSRPFEN